MAHCLVYIVGHGKYGFLGFGRSRHSHPTTIDNNCLIYLIWCFRPNMIVNWDHYLRYAFNKRLNTMKHQPAANFISTFYMYFMIGIPSFQMLKSCSNLPPILPGVELKDLLRPRRMEFLMPFQWGYTDILWELSGRGYIKIQKKHGETIH